MQDEETVWLERVCTGHTKGAPRPEYLRTSSQCGKEVKNKNGRADFVHFTKLGQENREPAIRRAIPWEVLENDTPPLFKMHIKCRTECWKNIPGFKSQKGQEKFLGQRARLFSDTEKSRIFESKYEK